MRKLAIFVVAFCGCADHQRASNLVPAVAERDPNWPQEWSAVVGKSVTLEGYPENWKQGPFLTSVGNGGVWIDGLTTWPSQCFADGKGKRVRVEGTVIEKKDVPAFVTKPASPSQKGKQPEVRLSRENRSRYLLTNVKWNVVN